MVFLDEAGAKTNMTRLRGRAPRGQRVYDSAPFGHWCTTTMLSAIRLDGSTASMLLEGPIDAEAFQAYVKDVLLPTVRAGDWVILDNLSPHKTPDNVALMESTGARVLFLPAYSPDFNPIEKMWSKVKASLRAYKARTQDALFEGVRLALASVTPDDAAGWFASCGYAIS